jgi:F-type H+-transporting ATPase subunit gamma
LTRGNSHLPFSYLPAVEVASGVAEHYLFHSLLALLLRSIRVENHMRLMQMETALRYLERGGEELQRQRNRLRQEEIVEEIELMVGRR